MNRQFEYKDAMDSLHYTDQQKALLAERAAQAAADGNPLVDADNRMLRPEPRTGPKQPQRAHSHVFLTCGQIAQPGLRARHALMRDEHELVAELDALHHRPDGVVAAVQPAGYIHAQVQLCKRALAHRPSVSFSQDCDTPNNIFCQKPSPSKTPYAAARRCG